MLYPLCGAIYRPVVGAFDKNVSCLLFCGHNGKHVWQDVASNIEIQWSDDPRERVVISWSTEDWDK